MKTGAKWLTTATLAGGLSALLVGGCGSSDSPTGPEWTSAAPVSTPASKAVSTVVVPDVAEAVPDDVVAPAAGDGAVVTGVGSTTVPTTSTVVPPKPANAPESPSFGEDHPAEPTGEVSTLTTAPLSDDDEEGAPPVLVNPDDFSLDVPDTGVPDVQDPVRIRYAEEQVQKIYFKWFDAIYRKEPEILWEAVATEGAYQTGVGAMERLTFTAPPSLEGVKVEVVELFIDHPDCLVASFKMDISAFRDASGLIEKAIIMWPDPRYGWRRNITLGLPTIYGMWWPNCFLADRPEFP